MPGANIDGDETANAMTMLSLTITPISVIATVCVRNYGLASLENNCKMLGTEI